MARLRGPASVSVFGVAATIARGQIASTSPTRVSSRYEPSWNRSLRTSDAAVDTPKLSSWSHPPNSAASCAGRIADEAREHRPELGHSCGREIPPGVGADVRRVAIREREDAVPGRGGFVELVARDGGLLEHGLTVGVEIERRPLGTHAELLEDLGTPRDRERSVARALPPERGSRRRRHRRALPRRRGRSSRDRGRTRRAASPRSRARAPGIAASSRASPRSTRTSVSSSG